MTPLIDNILLTEDIWATGVTSPDRLAEHRCEQHFSITGMFVGFEVTLYNIQYNKIILELTL